jgi:hypothetical protein
MRQEERRELKEAARLLIDASYVVGVLLRKPVDGARDEGDRVKLEAFRQELRAKAEKLKSLSLGKGEENDPTGKS